MKVLNVIKSIATDLIDINRFKSLVKIAGKSVDVAKSHPNSKNEPAVNEANECLSFLSSVLAIHTGLVGLKGFIKNVKNHKHLKGVERRINELEMVSQLSQMATGVLSSIKIGEKINQWAHAGEAMGKIPVSSTTPFTQATAVLGMINLSLQIGISILKLYSLEKKVNKVKDKVAFWQGDIDKTFIDNRIAHIQDKQDKLIEKVNAAEQKANGSRVQDKKEALKQEKGIKKAFAWVAYKHCKHSFLANQAKYQETFASLDQKHKNNEIKIENWTSISKKLDHLTPEDINDLNQLKRDKQAKYRTKKSNLRLDQWKTFLGTALKTAILITLIASFILTTTGTGTVPGLITLASLSLFLTVASLGLDYYKEYRKPRRIIPVGVPKLAVASGSISI